MPAGHTVQHSIARAPIRALRVEVIRGPDAGKSCTSQAEAISVGASQDNDLVLTDETVSRYHLELKHVGDRIVVEDLGSTNGTAHGKAMLNRATLSTGATLQLGRTTLKVDDGALLDLELHGDDELCGIRGRSQNMRRLMARVQKAAQSDVSILLLGETGVGKEVVASAVHRASPRASGPFETVDCGALAPTLIASELFGHEKGAFTGADRRYIGAFERADKGTLFLDEIGELPQSLQTILLGALERRSFRRVGGDKPINVDVRLVCATNRDLRAEVNASTFREDLYYRIAVVKLDIPALRERVEDVPILAEHFLRQAGCHEAVEEILPSQVMDTMLEYRWPGNVRELRNFVEAALAMGEAPNLEAGTLPPPAAPARARASSPSAPAAPVPVASSPARIAFPSVAVEQLLEQTFKDGRSLVLNEFEALYLTRLLERAEGNVSVASRLAEIHRTYLIEMLKRHGLR